MIPFSAQELHAFLRYDRKTGSLFWRVQPARRIPKGSLAGHLHPSGYIMVQVQGKIHGAHRLDNLRNVTRTENLRLHRRARSDSTTGLLGVSYRNDNNKYQARIQVNGVSRSLGVFARPEDAHVAYVAAKEGG